jgi:hypothetical protein
MQIEGFMTSTEKEYATIIENYNTLDESMENYKTITNDLINKSM